MSDAGPLTPPRAMTVLLDTLEAGDDAAVLLIVSHPKPTMIGGRVIVRARDVLGSLEDPSADDKATELARQGLSGSTEIRPGLQTLPLSTGGEVTVYLELFHPPSELVIVGAGHVAQPLSTLGALLGLRVRVLDDRPEFASMERFPDADQVGSFDFSDPFAGVVLHPWSHVILVTRGHRFDYECLRRVLQHDPLPGYVGMIGSRRRVRATFEALLEEGLSRDALAQVRAPIGLDLGGETPAEIALSIAAEIVESWRGGSGRPMRDHHRILERFFPQGGQASSDIQQSEGRS